MTESEILTAAQAIMVLQLMTIAYRRMGKNDLASETHALALKSLNKSTPNFDAWVKKFNDANATAAIERSNL